QKYCYQGLNGRLSDEMTSFSSWIVDPGIRTQYTYNAYGFRQQTRYPDEGVGRSVRDLTAAYTNGFQSSVRDTASGGAIHASGLEYNPAGGIWKIHFPG